MTETMKALSPAKRLLLQQMLRGEAGAPDVIPRLGGGPHALSAAQQRLWFLDRLEPGSARYTVPLALRLRGPLDRAVLGRALTEIVRRHEPLRTVFPALDGVPVQAVQPAAPLPLPVETVDEASLGARLEAEAARPFDLAAGPLLRATLLRIGADDHVLLLCIHHIACDAWSTGILVRELGALYSAFQRGEPSPLAEVEASYAEYAAWQNGRMDKMDSQAAYWKERLAGAPALLELPTDRPRSPTRGDRGATHRFTIPGGLVDALKALGRREGATLHMTLLAAWGVVLARYSAQDEVVIGTPVAGRPRRELEGMIGLFLNTLPLRVELAGDPSFLGLLGRVRETTLGAYQHQDLPFERLVETLAPERSASHTPLFQALFSLQNAPAGVLRIPGMEVEPVAVESGPAKFDLTLSVRERESEAAAALSYDASLWEPDTMRGMAEHLLVLLEGIAAAPERPLSRVAMMDDAERARVLVEWNDTARECPPELCHELFAAQARRTPDAVALVHGGETVTYAELDRRANRLANHLRGLGAGPEVRVAVCLERTPELVVALMAVLKAGAACVPLDPAYPPARLAQVAAAADARLMVTRAGLADRLPRVRRVRVDTDRARIARESDAEPRAGVRGESLAYVIFTSGSTGRPKGVMLRHQGIAVLLHWLRETVSDTERAAVLGATSVTFDVSLAEVFGTLCWGGKLVLVENALDLPRADVRLASMVPSAAAELLRGGGVPAGISLNLGGEPLPAVMVEKLHARGVRVRNLYGPTETTIYATCSGSASIGRPVANTRAYVLDAHLAPVPVGVPGELYLGGAGVARGYLGQPALTAERFIPDPFTPGARMYRTGDRVRWLASGEMEYLGRNDFQVKLRGFRIEPGEIEAALLAHPGVREAVVVAREDVPGERRLAAYLVGDEVAQAELRAHLRERLPEYMVPAAFVRLASLPRTTSGKADRGRLPAPLREAVRAEPLTGLEERVAALWAEVLGVERVGAHENFFDLGGHSLLAARLQARLRGELGKEVAMLALFTHPTVHSLAAHLAGEEDQREAVRRGRRKAADRLAAREQRATGRAR